MPKLLPFNAETLLFTKFCSVIPELTPFEIAGIKSTLLVIGIVVSLVPVFPLPLASGTVHPFP